MGKEDKKAKPAKKSSMTTPTSPPASKEKMKIITNSPSSVKCYKCREPCLDNDKITDEDMSSVQCDFCSKWFHKPCTNLSKSEWDIITGSNESITFCCDSCVDKKGQNSSMISDLKLDLQNIILSNSQQQQKMIQENNAFLLKSIEAMKVDLFQKIDEKIDVKLQEFTVSTEKMVDEKINARLPKDNSSKDEIAIEEKVKIQISQSFDELKEREERKNNLIIFNLKESLKEDMSEALKDDLHNIKEVLKITNPEMTENTIKDLTTSNINRLGRKPTSQENVTKVRPIKLSLPNEATKYKIIRNTHKLKSCLAYPKIGFKFDMTRQQQVEERELKQELERRKEAKEDVMIFRGKVILRQDHMKLKRESSSSKNGENNNKAE